MRRGRSEWYTYWREYEEGLRRANYGVPRRRRRRVHAEEEERRRQEEEERRRQEEEEEEERRRQEEMEEPMDAPEEVAAEAEPVIDRRRERELRQRLVVVRRRERRQIELPAAVNGIPIASIAAPDWAAIPDSLLRDYERRGIYTRDAAGNLVFDLNRMQFLIGGIENGLIIPSTPVVNMLKWIIPSARHGHAPVPPRPGSFGDLPPGVVDHGEFPIFLDGRVNHLKGILFTYILYKATKVFNQTHGGSFSLQLAFDQASARFYIGRRYILNPGAPFVMQADGLVDADSVRAVYFQLANRLLVRIIDTDHIDEDPDYDSFLLTIGGPYYMTIMFYALHDLMNPLRWDARMEELISKEFGNTGIVTVENNDEFCLLYCVAMGWYKDNCSLSGLSHIRRNHESCNLPLKDVLDVICKESIPREIINCETARRILQESAHKIFTLSQFAKLIRNMEDLLLPGKDAGINVYLMELDSASKKVIPVYLSKRSGKNIELLGLIHDKNYHYCLITNYRAVVGTRNGGKVFWTCRKCKSTFMSRKLLHTHSCEADMHGDSFTWSIAGIVDNCFINDDGDVPDADWICSKCHLQFNDHFRYQYHKEHCFMKGRQGCRYVKFAPVMAITTKKATPRDDTCCICFADFESYINPENGVHTPMSFGIYIGGKFNLYIDGRSMDEFLEILTELSVVHEEVKVFFHNAMGYDANFILKYVIQKAEQGNEEFAKWRPDVIMETGNRLKRLLFRVGDGKKKRTIEIGDTFKFFTMSLEKMVKSVRKETAKENAEYFERFFNCFRVRYPEISDDSINMVLRKNVFPYNFFTSPDKLDVGRDEWVKIFDYRNPENLKYFSEGTTVKDLEDNHPLFVKIVNDFRCITLGDYHDIYLMCDVLEVADIFMKARDILWESHKIDIAKYMGMPSASWAAFLQTERLHLELYRDTLYAEFFQQMTRGGVTSAVLRYAKADEDHEIVYLDVNGLYPHVMSKYNYPCGEFRWHNFHDSEEANYSKNKEIFDDYMTFLNSEDGKRRGACLCVDLDFPPDVRRYMDDFPFAPEHKILKDEFFDENGEMYDFMKRWSDKNGGEHVDVFRGLVGTSEDKKKYSVHWMLLRWYLNHGALLRKLHWAVSFEEAPVLKDYVDLNVRKRNEAPATDALAKMVYKLMSNSVYGKTFENPFNRRKFAIIPQDYHLTRMIEDGNVISFKPIPETEKCIVEVDGEEVILDRPTYIGACVTEFAKLHMYEIFYDKLKSWFGDDGVKLVYTDTDSFILRIKKVSKDEHVLDTMKRMDSRFLGSEGGQLKDEVGEPISEVIALRSKVYAYKTASGKVGMRAKGTTAAAQHLQLTWESFLSCLNTLESVDTRNIQFSRSGFSVATLEVSKKSLSANDGKRYICQDGIHTHAWGYPF